MPRTSPRQRKTIGRVMHEYKHGELGSGPGGADAHALLHDIDARYGGLAAPESVEMSSPR